MSWRNAPISLQQFSIYQQLNRRRRQRNLRKQLRDATPLKVVLGAGTTVFEGWIQTDKEMLDVACPEDWSFLFEPSSIDSILCEHMLEHLSEEEGRVAVKECYHYLKRGELFRVAVPDGYRRDATYIRETNPPSDGHLMLYNIDSLTRLLESVGFKTTPLEYFDVQEQFHAFPWDEKDGMVHRSVRFDTQEEFQRDGLFYTSLIIDARKQ